MLGNRREINELLFRRLPTLLWIPYIILLGTVYYTDDWFQSRINGYSQVIVRLLSEFNQAIDREIESVEEFNAAAEAIRNSVYIVSISFMCAMTLDAFAGFSVSNVIYGIAISGGSGIVASGADLIERQGETGVENVVSKYPGIYAEVSRTSGFLLFGVGFFLQMAVLFLDNRPMNLLPVLEPEFLTNLYILMMLVLVFLSSITDFFFMILVVIVELLFTALFGFVGFLAGGPLGAAVGALFGFVIYFIAWVFISMVIPLFRKSKRTFQVLRTPHPLEKH